MIIASIVFVCDLCGASESHSELTSDLSKVKVVLIDMTEGWSTIWIDANNYDTVCADCADLYFELTTVQNNHLWWLTRPIPEKFK